MNSVVISLLVGLGILGSLALAMFVGKQVGRRSRRESVEHPQLAVIEGAILALMGLLLGFTFSGAVTRFTARQDIMVGETNAVSTAFLRADLLDEPHRGNVKAGLREYTNVRGVELPRATGADLQRVLVRLDAVQQQLWQAATAGVKQRPEVTMAVIPPINDIFDQFAIRNAAADRHVPGLVLGALGACALASAAAIGFGLAFADRRVVAHAAVMAFLISAVMWVTIDLDYPRFGIIQISNKPFLDLQRTIAAP